MAADAVLAAIASELDVTPLQVVLAWLRTLAPVVVPIPGATRAETAVSAVQGQLLELKDEQRQALDEHFHPAVASRTSTRPPRPRSAALGEVVLVMGYPGAGKSTVAASLVAEGYERFNRDEQGGTLASLAASLDRGLEAGTSRAVLDNTYASRKSRNGVVEVARRHGAAVRCVWLGTSLEEAQVNVARRMIQCHGRLLTPEEMKSARQDSTAVPPRALFDYRRAFEEPALEEGFARIDEVPFERTAASGRSKRVLIVDYDQVAAADGALHPRCKEALQRYAAEGWAIALTAWWPDADDAVGKEASSRRAGRVARELALEIDLEYCRHGAGPPVCWCRKPLPGLGVVLIERHGLDPSESLLVASGPADRTFAARLGFSVVDANELF